MTLSEARSRLYRSQSLQVNTRLNSYLVRKEIEKRGHGERLKNENLTKKTRLKALDEIYIFLEHYSVLCDSHTDVFLQGLRVMYPINAAAVIIEERMHMTGEHYSASRGHH